MKRRKEDKVRRAVLRRERARVAQQESAFLQTPEHIRGVFEQDGDQKDGKRKGKQKDDQSEEIQDQQQGEQKHRRKKRKADPFEKVLREAAEARAERDRKAAERESNEAERRAKQRKRKKDHFKLMARTPRGQPVMSFQVAHLLSKIQKQ